MGKSRGSPTVLLDSGAGGDSSEWGQVQAGVAQFTRVCAYDRSGLGKSEAGPRPRTTRTVVSELRALLRNAKVPGPYIYVGHSISGFTARLFAQQAPQDVKGLVLVDTSNPDQFDRVLQLVGPQKEGEAAIIGALREEASMEMVPKEGLLLRRSADEVRPLGPFGKMPTVVLEHGKELLPPGTPISAAFQALWHQLQVKNATISSNTQLIVAKNSGHYIHKEQPELVIQSIRKVYDSVRGNTLLPACGQPEEMLGGECIKLP
ncbi:alpha/beta fold hydrolase [Deinococcus metallilatus]|nr:alpha/beta hydrolase [Deinococcus metallilatus]